MEPKKTQIGEGAKPVTMRFQLDPVTARAIKNRAKANGFLLPFYLAKVVKEALAVKAS